MEETNYDRKTIGVIAAAGSRSSVEKEVALNAGEEEKVSDDGPKSKGQLAAPAGVAALPEEVSTKSYWQKLSLIDKPRPFMMHYRAWQSLKLLSWPVVFYSGFSYGTYLIYFNILNATASLILSGPPYNFQPAFVGLAYISCLVGVTAA